MAPDLGLLACSYAANTTELLNVSASVRLEGISGKTKTMITLSYRLLVFQLECPGENVGKFTLIVKEEKAKLKVPLSGLSKEACQAI